MQPNFSKKNDKLPWLWKLDNKDLDNASGVTKEGEHKFSVKMHILQVQKQSTELSG